MSRHQGRGWAASEQDAIEVVRARVFMHDSGGLRSRQYCGMRAEVASKLQDFQYAGAPAFGKPGQRRRLDIDHIPAGVERLGQTRRCAHQHLPIVGADAHQKRLRGTPDGTTDLGAAVTAHLAVDTLGGQPQGELPQR